jgi:hypothetical protein
MATRVQILPYVVVPKSPNQNFRATINLNQFEKKYHALTALYQSENNINYRQLTFRPKSWSYGDRDLVKFLITGYLPKSAFYEKCKASERRKTKTKKISPTDKEEGTRDIFSQTGLNLSSHGNSDWAISELQHMAISAHV